MPVFILYFLAAGAASIGGPAIGAVLYKRGQAEAASYERKHEIDTIARLLRSEIDLQVLRSEAHSVGIDPDAVVRGYLQLRDGQVTIDQVMARLDAGASR